MQEISSHAFNRNDWLCLYLSLAFAVLERCVPTFLCGRKRWFKKEVVITVLNVIKHFYHNFDSQILEHKSERKSLIDLLFCHLQLADTSKDIIW